MATAAASVSIITPEVLLQRARDLIPALKARSVASIIARLSECFESPTVKLMAESAATPFLETARSRDTRSPSASV